MRKNRVWFWDSKIQSRNNRLTPRSLLKCFGLPALAALVCVPGVQTHKSNTVAPKAAKSTAKRVARPRASEDYGRLPLSFEVNQGQTDAQVRFLARGQGYTLFLTSQEAVLSLHKSEGKRVPKEGASANPGSKLETELAGRFALFEDRTRRTAELSESQGGESGTNTVLQMRLAGASFDARVKGEEELSGKSNYFIGNDPKKWRTNIPTYAKVRVEDIYPGVDLVYYGNQGQLEYDFVVRPGADPSEVKLALTSGPSTKGRDSRGSVDATKAASTKIDDNGDLVVPVDGSEVRFHKPVIYQPAFSGKVERAIPVEGHYTINEQNEVAFAIGDYDRTRPLVIDPVLVYSTYLGGGGYYDGFEYNQVSAIAVDSSGNAYVTGFTRSPNFPTTLNSYQPAMPSGCAPQYDAPCAYAFVTKLSPDGSSLVYSTFLGGGGANGGYGIAVDSSGNAYVTGSTTSTDFPTLNALQGTNRDYPYGSSAFVTEVNAGGSALVYSTYLGGTGNSSNYRGDSGIAIAVDGSGNAYVTGQTYSHDFPTASPIQATNQSASSSNAFVAEISAGGSALIYSTYLGGTGMGPYGDFGAGIATDTSGNAYVTGQTYSHDFPTASPIQATNQSASASNAFVAKINAGGSALIYSTYLGGTGYESGAGIATDTSGNAYVTGTAYSSDFPTTPSAFQGTNHGGNDAFVTKLSPDGSALVYSTYLGGSGGDAGYGIAVSGLGFVYVTGLTTSNDFPTANPIQAANNSPSSGSAFVAQLTPDGSALVYSTYLGGACGQPVCDEGLGIAADSSRNAYVAGLTYSQSFPTTPNAFQKTNRGADNGFVARIAPGTGTADLMLTNIAPSSAMNGLSLTYTIVATNNGPDEASDVNVLDAVPVGTTFSSVSISAGSCTGPAPGGTGTVTCTVNGLASGSFITETLVVNVNATDLPLSTITDTATASSAAFDPNTANNSATATTTVI